jgi:hypothetical protein
VAPGEFIFRPTGIGRWFEAAFLAVWLCGWAAGEAFALWFLGTGAVALITGQPPGAGHEPLTWGAAGVVGLFLLLWLSFWTVGGIAAGQAFLANVWGSDRLVAGPGQLEIERRYGPFVSRKVIPVADILGIDVGVKNGPLRIETPRGMVDVTSVGTRDERAAAAKRLEAHYRPRRPETPLLPPEWQEIRSDDGAPALVPNLGTRRNQVTVMLIVTALVGAVATAVVNEALQQPRLIVMALIVVGIALALGAGAAWLAWTRTEWRLSRGSLTQRRHAFGDTRDLFTARALQLSTYNDSDGDDWYYLDAVATPGQPAHGLIDRSRRRLAKSLRDPWLPRRLGEFIAARTGVPLEERR